MSLHMPKPMLATLARELPVGSAWTYEVKFDGYRTLAVKDGDRVTLYSRNLEDATRQYAPIAQAVAMIPVRAPICDGELVAADADGRPSFQALHHQEAHHLAYYVFDLLHLDGRDLTREPLRERCTLLAPIPFPHRTIRPEGRSRTVDPFHRVDSAHAAPGSAR